MSFFDPMRCACKMLYLKSGRAQTKCKKMVLNQKPTFTEIWIGTLFKLRKLSVTRDNKVEIRAFTQTFPLAYCSHRCVLTSLFVAVNSDIFWVTASSAPSPFQRNIPLALSLAHPLASLLSLQLFLSLFWLTIANCPVSPCPAQCDFICTLCSSPHLSPLAGQ